MPKTEPLPYTATLDASHSAETVISFAPSGRAVLDGDYTVSYTGKNVVKLVKSGLNYPYSIAIDKNGDLYISEKNGHRIKKCLGGGLNSCTIVAGGNGSGDGANELSSPMDVAVDADLNIYVADYGNHRIQKFPAGSSSSTNGTTVGGGNSAGFGLNQLNNPVGVALDASKNVYVNDGDNSRVIKFNAGSSSSSDGSIVAGGNGEGSGAHQFDNGDHGWPQGLYVDSDLSIYICDEGNNRVQKWISGATSGTTFSSSSGSVLWTPDGISADLEGNTYIADQTKNRITKHTSSSSYSIVSGIGGYGYGRGDNVDELEYPTDVAFDPAGNLYVVDRGKQSHHKEIDGCKYRHSSGSDISNANVIGHR